MTILIVEDNSEIAAIFAEMLAAEGYEFTIAITATAALERLTRGDIELALVDLSLPDFDGIQMATMAREAGIDTPMLVVSGAADRDKPGMGLFAEVFDKPVRASALMEAVAKHRKQGETA